MSQVVAFIGIGIMGGRMAKNLLKAGHAIRAYNRTAAKTEGVRKLGATVSASPREAAMGADAVITMVADPAALAKGLGELDQTATIQVLEEIAGVRVRQRSA